MDKNYGIIYRIINIENGKCYIGQTKEYYGNKIGGAKRRW